MSLLMLMAARSRLNHTATGPFTPLANFASGERGGWWDPSDLTTMFQDSAGTTAVTGTGQSVGKILDKSGNGNHLTQATSGKRPVLQQDSNGHYYLQFTASASQYLDGTNTGNLAPGTACLMSIAGAKFDDGSASRSIYSRAIAAAAAGRYSNHRNSSGSLIAFYTPDTGAGASGGASDTSTAIRVLSVLNDRTAGTETLRVNGATFGTAATFTSDISTFQDPGDKFLMGAFSNADGTAQISFMNGRIYGLILRFASSIDMTLLGKNESWMTTATS